MAFDKAVDSAALDANLKTVADAIREKAGTSDSLVFPTGFAEAIAGIQAGGGGSDEEWFNDGDTHIWITIPDDSFSPMVGVCLNGTATVDWGDGTTPDTLKGTSLTMETYAPAHNYAAAGDYVITLSCDGEIALHGGSISEAYGALIRYSASKTPMNLTYKAFVTRVEIGRAVTSIMGYAFAYFVNLKSISMQYRIESIGKYAFGYGPRIEHFGIPDGVETLPKYMLDGNNTTRSFTFPASVTTIESGACSASSCCQVFDFSRHTAVPTLESVFAFPATSRMLPSCEFRVPAALYDEWIAATNWSDLASYIVAV